MTYVPTEPQPRRDGIGRSIGRTALTREDVPLRAVVQYVTLSNMHILVRDWRVLSHVSRFGQLTTPQIRALEFATQRSRTPCDHRIQMMVKAGLLAYVDQPSPGGRQGGRGVNVLELGVEGWPLFNKGRRRPSRIIRPHALTVADVYVAAVEASRDGWLDILEWLVEADAWVTVAGADIRPDLYIDLGQREAKKRYRLNVEVDLGGERQKQIVEKLERYVYAAEHVAEYPDGAARQVLFLATDDERLADLKRIVRRFNAPDGLVMIEKVENFPHFLR